MKCFSFTIFNSIISVGVEDYGSFYGIYEMEFEIGKFIGIRISKAKIGELVSAFNRVKSAKDSKILVVGGSPSSTFTNGSNIVVTNLGYAIEIKRESSFQPGLLIPHSMIPNLVIALNGTMSASHYDVENHIVKTTEDGISYWINNLNFESFIVVISLNSDDEVQGTTIAMGEITDIADYLQSSLVKNEKIRQEYGLNVIGEYVLASKGGKGLVRFPENSIKPLVKVLRNIQNTQQP